VITYYWFILLFLFFLLIPVRQLAQEPRIRFEVLIQNDGDEFLISDIHLDLNGSIYLLDALRRRILELRDGQTSPRPIADKAFRERRTGELIALTRGPLGRFYIIARMGKEIFAVSQQGSIEQERKVPFRPQGIAFQNRDELLVLGEHDGKMFHVFDPDGQRKRSFGEMFERLDRVKEYEIGPFEWYVEGDTIYVASPFRYEIQKHVKERFEKSIVVADTIVRQPEVRTHRDGSVTITMPHTITGIASAGSYLFVSLCSVSKVSSQYYLDVLDVHKGQIVSRIPLDQFLMVRKADTSGKVFLVGNNIIQTLTIRE